MAMPLISDIPMEPTSSLIAMISNLPLESVKAFDLLIRPFHNNLFLIIGKEKYSKRKNHSKNLF
jgi:hypothetical protein